MAEKKESAEATVGTIRRVTRKKHSAEEKVRIVLERLRVEHAAQVTGSVRLTSPWLAPRASRL